MLFLQTQHFFILFKISGSDKNEYYFHIYYTFLLLRKLRLSWLELISAPARYASRYSPRMPQSFLQKRTVMGCQTCCILTVYDVCHTPQHRYQDDTTPHIHTPQTICLFVQLPKLSRSYSYIFYM